MKYIKITTTTYFQVKDEDFQQTFIQLKGSPSDAVEQLLYDEDAAVPVEEITLDQCPDSYQKKFKEQIESGLFK